MHRVLIIADVPGWAYDRRARALEKYRPAGFEVDVRYVAEIRIIDFRQYDLVFNIDYSMTQHVRQWIRNQESKAKLVVSHNADHQRCHELYEMSRAHADFIIFNNHSAYEHFGKKDGTCNISNGVDLEHFYPLQCERSDSALWTGGEGKKGHKDFLIPFCEKYPEVNVVTKPIKANTWANGNPSDELWGTDRMREFYNGSKVVLCFSETDATPNYVLEGMACGLVPVTVRVGNALEFGEHNRNVVFVDRKASSFREGIEYAIDNYDELSIEAMTTIMSWDWQTRNSLFFEVFQGLIEGHKIEPFTYMDRE